MRHLLDVIRDAFTELPHSRTEAWLEVRRQIAAENCAANDTLIERGNNEHGGINSIHERATAELQSEVDGRHS